MIKDRNTTDDKHLTAGQASLGVDEEQLAIAGVILKKLVRHSDERGFFLELIRCNDECFAEGFGQLNHTKMYPEVIKAWHIHKNQVDWWYVPAGCLKVGLSDQRPDSVTYGKTITLFMGEDHEPAVLRIPPGVAHGCKAVGGVTHLIYVTSRMYDPTDEGRLSHDDAAIGYDWKSGAPIK